MKTKEQLKQYQKEYSKKYREKYRSELNRKKREYYHNNKSKILVYNKKHYNWNKMTKNEYMKNWREHNSQRAKEIRNKSNIKLRFGGNRDKVLERDNWRCRECGMTQEQHMIFFNRSLIVHHIDGKGRYSSKKNHSIDNLLTLCIRCHNKKESLIRENDIKNKKQAFVFITKEN